MEEQQCRTLESLQSLLASVRAFDRAGRVSPHKWVMLLACAAVLENDPAHGNRFTFDELEPIFARLFESHVPEWPTERRLLEYPFYHSQHDASWHLVLIPGTEAQYREYEQTRLTRSRLRDTVLYGYFDADVFVALTTPAGKRLVEEKLMSTVFGPRESGGYGENQAAESSPGYSSGPLPPAVFNPFVAYLNTLSSASAGNEHAMAEAQAGSAMFERIRVANPVTGAVQRRLLEERRHVILTGNAGDGKTSVAAELYRELTGEAMPAQARVEVRAAGLVILKDMSEWPEDERTRVLREAASAAGPVYLIVTNTGTLLESARQLAAAGAEREGITNELLRALEANETTEVLGRRFALLNVGRTDSIAVACQVLERMLAAGNWEVCAGCGLEGGCPVARNVALASESHAVLLERVGLAYRRLYEYGVRLTLRQMTGHLAHALVGGLDCARVAGMSLARREAAREGALFHNLFFGDEGEGPSAGAEQLRAVRELQAAELGGTLDARFEREAWIGSGVPVPLAEEAKGLFEGLRRRGGPAARRQGRRVAFFYGRWEEAARRRYVGAFLRSPRLLDWVEVARGAATPGGLKEQELRCQVLQVLQEHLAGVHLPERSLGSRDWVYLTLTPRRLGTRTQVVLAKLKADEFRVVEEPGHRDVQGSGGRLFLEERGGGPRLPLDLPFLDYARRRYEGEVAQALAPFYADRLERFGAELLRRHAGEGDGQVLELVRIGADRRFRRLEVSLKGERLEVLG